MTALAHGRLLAYGIAALLTARLSAAQKKVLIYSYVAPGEFVHDSIPTATQALISRGNGIGVSFDSTQDPSQFTATNLKAYDGLLFLMTIGEVLNSAQQQAFQDYLDGGGNFIAVHAASDCLRNASWYGQEVGAFFDYHPVLQNATVDVIDSSHPSTSMLPSQWHVQDEMYNFKSDPRSVGAVVLLSANDSSYNDPGPRKFNQGSPHPTAWYQEKGAGVDSNGTSGRSFYTSLGHLSETWQDDIFLSHVLGGVQWALESTTAANASSSSSSSTSATGTSAAAGASSTAASASQSSATKLGSMGQWAASFLSALGLLVFVP